MPAPLQPAVRSRYPLSSITKDQHSYLPNNMSSMEKIGKVRMTTTTTLSNKNSNLNRNNKSTAIAMPIKEHPLLQSSKLATTSSTIVKPKKAEPQRPVTPHSSQPKNYIKQNKQNIQTIATNKTSPNVSPQPTIKRSNITPPATRPITPHAPRSSGEKLAGNLKEIKKRPDISISSSAAAAAPPAAAASAHNRSHTTVPRTPTPDASLIQENKRLKEFLTERTQELREAENEIQEFEEVIKALQERVRQVEARNRELQSEKDILRAKLLETAPQSAPQTPSNILSDILKNHQRIRGETTENVVTPIVPVTPVVITAPTSSSPVIIPVKPISASQPSVLSSLIAAPVTMNSFNVSQNKVKPSAAPLPQRNIVVTAAAPAPLDPEILVQPRHNLILDSTSAAFSLESPNFVGSAKSEMLDRHAEPIRDRQALCRAKAAAALNCVMEESESEEDEFLFEQEEENVQNPIIFSKIDDSSYVSSLEGNSEEENEMINYNGPSAAVAALNNVPFITSPITNDKFDMNRKSNISTQQDLNVIPEEEEDDEDDEFELPPNFSSNPKQHLDQISTVAMGSKLVASIDVAIAQAAAVAPVTFNKTASTSTPISPKSPQRRLRRYRPNSISSSDSGMPKDEAHKSQPSFFDQTTTDNPNLTSKLVGTQSINDKKQQYPSSSVIKSTLEKSQNYSSTLQEPVTTIHRESFSSVQSDDSDMSSLSVLSHHDSFSSSATSASTTRTTQSTNSFSECGSLSQRSLNSVTNQTQNLSTYYHHHQSSSDFSQLNENTNIFCSNGLAQTDSTNGNDQHNSSQSVTNSHHSQTNLSGLQQNDQPNNNQRSQSPHSVTSTVSSTQYSVTPVQRLSTPDFSASSISNQIFTIDSHSRSSTPHSENNYRVKVTTPHNEISTSMAYSNNSSRVSTPSHLNNVHSNSSSSRSSTPAYQTRARAPSPPSSSSRASTPASESSRSASPRHNRSSQKNSPIPPPPPAATTNSKDPFATFQHYLRLLSETCSLGDPLKSYNVQKVIDEGSSAKVYNATSLDSNDHKEYAIKIIPLTYSLEFIYNEIFILQNLKHKNVVNFKESFLRWDGKTREIWIVMEKCARGDVTSKAGKVSQKEVSRIARDILSSLKHLHDNGIIHRDIKLSNILMAANNDVKLADFGISSLTPTSTTGMVGTIPYMAPDIVNVKPDNPYSTKVDTWSVGVCILELLTGKAAWGRIRDDEIMDKLRRGEKPYGFERLRKKADIGWEAIDFLNCCFIKDSEMRSSADQLLQHPFITGLLY
ncbi:hypothetical protein G9A89_018366 [Geosiphon pyriformis]|nr:hypothetical protein G9A89_018366 [Geosiphon pyriformis]